ncbi:MAG: long-chain-acyl-CoA synthetase [Alphaproteobacteria bacterium]
MGLLREIRYLKRMAGPAKLVLGLKPGLPRTTADVMEEVVDAHGEKPAIFFQDQVWTYNDLEEAANRIAHFLHAQGLAQGDVVALNMENRPEFIATWFGAAKAGVTAALINTNLGGQQLAHCLNVSNAKLIILGAELYEKYETAKDALTLDAPAFVQGGHIQGTNNLDDALADLPTTRPAASLRAGMTMGDNDHFYIYTSGTTGLPKAAHFSHLKFLTTGAGTAGALDLKPGDRHYICLPLYHSAGGAMAAGAVLTSGAAMVLTPKFSASRFFKDAVEYNVTSFQYIGELLRYLLNAPVQPEEKQHKIKLAIGNGLRPEIWDEVEERFNLNHIIEFYGATEGNVILTNLEGKKGTIGRMPGYLRKAAGMTCVKFDVETDDVVRGPDGLCIECKPGEAGEAVGRINFDSKSAAGRFEGYSDEAASSKKILRDVFKKGDAYFRSGDLLKFDRDGYWYFVDRIGDTFRWKGENVATSEVAEVMAVMNGVQEVNIYGVQVPGADGRAGMASIVTGEGFDLQKLYDQTEIDLASYARPLFVRLQGEMEITGTFKHRKVELAKDGFDPAKVNEPLYFRDSAAGAYVPLDEALHAKLLAGDIRL